MTQLILTISTRKRKETEINKQYSKLLGLINRYTDDYVIHGFSERVMKLKVRNYDRKSYYRMLATIFAVIGHNGLYKSISLDSVEIR